MKNFAWWVRWKRIRFLKKNYPEVLRKARPYVKELKDKIEKEEYRYEVEYSSRAKLADGYLEARIMVKEANEELIRTIAILAAIYGIDYVNTDQWIKEEEGKQTARMIFHVNIF